MAAATGTSEAIADFVAAAELPAQAEVLGPVPVTQVRGAGDAEDGAQERALIRIRRQDGLALARALHAAQAIRSARKDGGVVRVQLDPAEIA
jgi:primosomal protein N' (replication factor Y)